MNAPDILKYGHDFVTRHLKHFPEGEWETPNVCGCPRHTRAAANLTFSPAPFFPTPPESDTDSRPPARSNPD